MGQSWFPGSYQVIYFYFHFINLFHILQHTHKVKGFENFMNNYMPTPQFLPGTRAISIVNHPPEIHPGTPIKIVKPWFGNLCAVQLPDGMIHRWFCLV
jgi:hypothetical protein